MSDNTVLISIVTPAYNEDQNITPLVESIDQTLKGLNRTYTYELIIVDDGSKDQTWQRITEVISTNSRVKGVRLARNFGQQLALTAGIDVAKGAVLIYLDSDLQHPPELIPQLITEWERGFEVVHTNRVSTNNEPWFKKVLSHGFYTITSFLSDTPKQAGMGDYKLLDKKVYDQLKGMREKNRFIRGMVPWIGYSSTVVDYTASKRSAGKPRYNMKRSFGLAQIGIMSLTTKPLRYIAYLGISLSVIAFLALLAAFVFMFFQHDFRYISPIVLLVVFNTILIGIVLSTLGIISLYLSYLHKEIIGRPLYIVRETTNIKS